MTSAGVGMEGAAIARRFACAAFAGGPPQPPAAAAAPAGCHVALQIAPAPITPTAAPPAAQGSAWGAPPLDGAPQIAAPLETATRPGCSQPDDAGGAACRAPAPPSHGGISGVGARACGSAASECTATAGTATADGLVVMARRCVRPPTRLASRSASIHRRRLWFAMRPSRSSVPSRGLILSPRITCGSVGQGLGAMAGGGGLGGVVEASGGGENSGV